MNKKYNFIYKTTNLINNKIYIGVHSTNDLNDGYLGSGNLLKKAIKKYNKNNFKRDIIDFFDNIEDCYIQESKLVDLNFIKDVNSYNITIGGKGGMSNMVIIKKEHNKFSKITKEEFDSNNCLVGSMKNKIVVIDKISNTTHRIEKNEFDANKYINFFSGKVSTKKDGKNIKVTKEEFDNNPKLFGITKGFVTVSDGLNYFQVSINDSRYLNSELTPPSKNLVVAKNKNTNETIVVTKQEFNKDSNLVGITFGSKQTKESNLKRSQKLKGRKPSSSLINKVDCPYCKKNGSFANMKRWHFDNCKYKNNKFE